MRKIIIILVLGAVVVYGSLKGYIWYTIKSNIDDVITMAAPFAKITYGSIYASLDGKIGLTDIKISPLMLQDTFSIGSIIYDAKSLEGLWKLRQSKKQNEFPHEFDFSINKFKLDLYASYLDQLDAQLENNISGSPFDALGCAEVSQIGPNELREMGYDTIDLSIKFGFLFDPNAQTVTFRGTFNADKVSSADFSYTIDIGISSLAISNAPAASPRLTNASITTRDYSYNQRRNQYCADKLGATLDEYLDNHIELVKEYLEENGITYDEILIEAYREYITKAGEVYVAANPVDPVPIMGLDQYSFADLVYLLNLDLQVNGKTIDLTSININKPTVKRKRPKKVAKIPPSLIKKKTPKVDNATKPKDTSAPTATKQTTDTDLAKLEDKPRRFPHYRKVPVAKLIKYIGQPVKIYMKDGRRLRGVILSIKKSVIKLERHASFGTMTMHISKKQIKTVEVYH